MDPPVSVTPTEEPVSVTPIEEPVSVTPPNIDIALENVIDEIFSHYPETPSLIIDLHKQEARKHPPGTMKAFSIPRIPPIKHPTHLPRWMWRHRVFLKQRKAFITPKAN